MSFASPPTYRLRRKKSAQFDSGGYQSEQIGQGIQNQFPQSPPMTAWGGHPMFPGQHVPQPQHTGTTPVAPGSNPGQPAAPGPPPGVAPSGPPPETLSGLNTKLDANEQYGIQMADINRQILEAAQNYGGVNSVMQAALDPQGHDIATTVNVAQDPNSAISGINRDLTNNTRGINEDLNNRGSFFSGAHLDQQQKLVDEENRQRLAAQTAFEQALSTLTNQLAQARQARVASGRDADLGDLQAALAETPTPQANTAGNASQAVAAANNPVAPSGHQTPTANSYDSRNMPRLPSSTHRAKKRR